MCPPFSRHFSSFSALPFPPKDFGNAQRRRSMMEIVSGLAHGFAMLLSPMVLAACVLGLVTGIVAGFLPCLSPAGALALQVPFAVLMALSFGVQSPSVFVVAFAYGTLYGRALAAMNQSAPNKADSASLPQGERPIRFATLFVGIVTAAAMGVCTTSFGRHIALQLGPAELVSLMVFLLLGGAAFGRGSAASALAMVALGLLLGLVGTDIETGEARFTFGIAALDDGLGVIDVALGLFVIANVIDDLSRTWSSERSTAVAQARSAPGFWPATILAVLAGFLPTNGATFATTVSAARSRPTASLFDPASQGRVTDILRAAMLSDIRLSVSLIPVFLLLAPVDAVTPFLRNIVSAQAVMMGGNDVMANLAPIAWLVFATLIVAHVVPLIILMRLAKAAWRPIPVDARIVAPLLVAAACVVSWQLHDEYALAHICIMLAFGLIGYAMIRAGFDRSLMFFAFVIAVRLEENIRRSLLISRGDPMPLLQRPITAGLLLAGALLFVVTRTLRHRRLI
jgi:putative tricarboxylic transport membrane protein